MRMAFSRMNSPARKRSGWSVNWSVGKNGGFSGSARIQASINCGSPSPVSADSGNTSVEFVLLAHPGDKRKQLFLLHAVNLVEQQIDRPVKPPRALQSQMIVRPQGRCGIQHQRQNVHSLQRLPHFLHHLPVQRRRPRVHARRINQHHLRIRPVDDSLNAVARRLRPRSDDRHLPPDQRVYQGGFPAFGRPMMAMKPE